MKQQIQLQIPEPCHESWDKMTATQQGRFCMSCQKQVVDFSVMTDVEILAFISNASGNTCGRVGNDQLNRNLVEPGGYRSVLWKYWMGITASFMLLTFRSTAQGKIVKHTTVSKHPNVKADKPRMLGGAIAVIVVDKPIEIYGMVTDNKNNPVPYASVRIKGSAVGVAANAAGMFKLNTNKDLSDVELLISSVGFNAKHISLDSMNNGQLVSGADGSAQLNVGQLQLIPMQLDEVVVNGNSLKYLQGYAGGISVCRKISKVEKATTKFKDTFDINEIKSYPNPIASTSEFQLRYKLKEKGEYQLRFTDASGRIIASRQVNIASNNQLESFNAGLLGSSGIYFASISNKKTGKTYTTRLLLQ